MNGKLRCYSFHSVKGGVGKSTLSAVAAVQIAATHSEAPVYLIDMDLTGTSLADVLPIEAPSWNGVPEGTPLDLQKPPTAFHPRPKSRTLIERRQEMLEERQERHEEAAALGVPFLNDFLLFATPNWDEEQDVLPSTLCWRMAGGPENLRVVPSSALPLDLERTLPVIYDEEHAAFLEARLEHLLDALVPESGKAFVIFDTPPTIPGLSRSVLNLAFRLSREPKTALSEDGIMPARLEHCTLTWNAFLVATLDYQDLRAAERWLSLVRGDEGRVLKPLLNRVKSGNRQQNEALLQDALSESASVLLRDPVLVEEAPGLQFFQNEQVPPQLDDLMSFIKSQP